VRYQFINDHERAHRITAMCRVLNVSRSGYYGWKVRPECVRARENRRLLTRIQAVHVRSHEAYGVVKTVRALAEAGRASGHNRVARLRRIHGIVAKRVRRFRLSYAARNSEPAAPNRLERQFGVAAPNRVWVGDVTCVPTREGWLYLAVLLDLYSRKVVGWAMSARINAALVLQALQMALSARRPAPGLIHHTDHGAIYTADAYRAQLAAHGMSASMGRRGDCYDNAVAESFFSTVKNELTVAQVYPTRRDAQTALFEYIEVFYNRQRRHQTLGYRTPQHVEAQALSLN